jgi:hypothetical protein
MAYSSFPHGTTNFCPYYLLHCIEPVLPTIQGHQANLHPYIKGTDNEARLKQLQNILQLAFENSTQEHTKVTLGQQEIS